MKIILSRKGFDSSNGGIPSPILPNGNIVSLPILGSKSLVKFCDLHVKGYNISRIVTDLSKKKIQPQQYVHLDPDIDNHIIANRPKKWRGTFGQVGAAQKHLKNNCLNKGDLFIYFGWFREIEKYNGVWRFKLNSPNRHIIYGWLSIEHIIPVYDKEKKILKKYPWLKHHPHLCGMKNKLNTIYISSQTLPIELGCNNIPGSGVFKSVRDIQILTDTSQKNKSCWKLPSSFYPNDSKSPLSYHKKKERWKLIDKKWVRLNSVGRGQEFVLDLNQYSGVKSWLRKLFRQQCSFTTITG